MQSYVVFDLGAESSRAAIPSIADGAKSARCVAMPSAVWLPPSAAPVLGDRARRAALSHAEVLDSVTPWFAADADDAEGVQQARLGAHALEAHTSGAGEIHVAHQDGVCTFHELAARQLAELHLDLTPDTADSIAYFAAPAGDPHLQQALRQAAALAGLTDVRFVEPLAVAAWHYAQQHAELESTALFAEHGATHSAYAIVRFEEGRANIVRRAVLRDAGTRDFDFRIEQWIIDALGDDAGTVTQDPLARARIRDAATKLRVRLDEAESVDVELPFLWADASGPRHFSEVLRREDYDAVVRDLLREHVEVARGLVAAAGVESVDRIVVCGCAAADPSARYALESAFEQVPEAELTTANAIAEAAVAFIGQRGERQVDDVALTGLWTRPSGDENAEPHSLRAAQAPVSTPTRLDLTQDRLALYVEADASQVDAHLVRDNAATTRARVDIDAGHAYSVLDPDNVRIEWASGLTADEFSAAHDQLAPWLHERREQAQAAHRRTRIRELTASVQSVLGDPMQSIDDASRGVLNPWVQRALDLAASDEPASAYAEHLEAYDHSVGELPSAVRKALGWKRPATATPAPVDAEPAAEETEVASPDTDDTPATSAAEEESPSPTPSTHAGEPVAAEQASTEETGDTVEATVVEAAADAAVVEGDTDSTATEPEPQGRGDGES